MKRDILFYQANFEPEVCRTLDALEKNDTKHFEFFKNKTLKIVDEILKLSQKFVEKEEWFAIRNMVADMEFINNEEKSVIRNYGHCFSLKFGQIMSLL